MWVEEGATAKIDPEDRGLIFFHTPQMPEVMLGENGEEYVLDAFGPATRGRGLYTVYSGGPHASCTSACAPAAPEPTSSIPPTPPLAPFPNDSAGPRLWLRL